MVWLLKSKYEKQAEKLRGKLLRIIRVMDSLELRQLCLNVVHKVPSNGLKLFDSDYNLIKKFSDPIRRDDYLLFFAHYHMLGKILDMNLARYLIKIELFDETDPDYVFIKKYEKPTDNDDDPPIIREVIDKDIPRYDFSKETKEKLLKLQRYRCSVPRCRFSPNLWRYLEFDHIKYRDDNSLTNCQALCPLHHRLKTKMEWLKIKAAKELVDGKRNTTRMGRTPSRRPHRNDKKIRKTSRKF